MKQKITMQKKEELTIEGAFTLFLRKAAVRNLSENTMKTYKYHYDAFCRYTDKEGSSADYILVYLKVLINIL